MEAPTELRRSQRERKAPDKFTFDKAHGYNAAKRMMKTLILSACTMTGVSDSQYLHGLMLNEYGTLNNLLPHFGYTFKANKKKDPDTQT